MESLDLRSWDLSLSLRMKTGAQSDGECAKWPNNFLDSLWNTLTPYDIYLSMKICSPSSMKICLPSSMKICLPSSSTMKLVPIEADLFIEHHFLPHKTLLFYLPSPLQAEIDSLAVTKEKLKTGQQKLEDIISKLETEQVGQSISKWWVWDLDVL